MKLVVDQELGPLYRLREPREGDGGEAVTLEISEEAFDVYKQAVERHLWCQELLEKAWSRANARKTIHQRITESLLSRAPRGEKFDPYKILAKETFTLDCIASSVSELCESGVLAPVRGEFPHVVVTERGER